MHPHSFSFLALREPPARPALRAVVSAPPYSLASSSVVASALNFLSHCFFQLGFSPCFFGAVRIYSELTASSYYRLAITLGARVFI